MPIIVLRKGRSEEVEAIKEARNKTTEKLKCGYDVFKAEIKARDEANVILRLSNEYRKLKSDQK